MGRRIFFSANVETGALSRSGPTEGNTASSSPCRSRVAPRHSLGTPRRALSAKRRQKNLERATRRFWHALPLAIDAKLGAAAAGIATLESEFLAMWFFPGTAPCSTSSNRSSTLLTGPAGIPHSAVRTRRCPLRNRAPPRTPRTRAWWRSRQPLTRGCLSRLRTCRLRAWAGSCTTWSGYLAIGTISVASRCWKSSIRN